MIKTQDMLHKTLRYPDLNIMTALSMLTTEHGIAEYHAIITGTPAALGFKEQLSNLLQAYADLRHKLGDRVKPVFKRYFLSDSANQAKFIPRDEECACSIVEQSPLNGTKIAMWVYLQQDVKTQSKGNGVYAVSHGAYTHFWQGGAATPDIQSETATRALLLDYSLQMEDEGCTLAQNCMRTWFFVHDVDVNYAGMVKGRNEVFTTSGLTRDTHFIASTGIGGRHPDPRVTVSLDTYSLKGISEGQVKYLYAPTHLNPTYEYGVAFERGACVDYGDRRHVFISGTASINNRGEIEHKGDIKGQTLRMWENVRTLLNEAACDWDDVCHMIVYLRDIADYNTVDAMYREQFPHIPHVIVLAPVCRPEWLIEMECMAIKPQSCSEYAPL